tara:strand:+ start:115 stop:972 length:858 start_codon:yes stop_codon:yes gene_type:complete
MKKSELKEIIKEAVFEKMTEELCKKGKAYIAKRKRAGEKSSAYLSGRAVKVCKGMMQGENTLNEFVGKELEDRNEPLYDKLVAGMGKSETVEGEMLRAINRIAYRYYNDGDEYMRGYGTETAGPAHSFLVNASHPLKSLVSTLFSKGTDYEQTIKDVLDAILDYIESRQGKYTPNNVGDMFDYEPEFEDDEYEEEDYDADYDEFDNEEQYQESALKKSKKGMAMYGKKAKMDEDIEAKDSTKFRIKLKHLLQKHATNLKKGSDDTEFELTLKHLLDKHIVKGGKK